MTPTPTPASTSDTGMASSAPRIWALIPCAGSGSRAGGALPKQYQRVGGLPMVLHSLHAFAAVPEVAGSLLVLSPYDTNCNENIGQNIGLFTTLLVAFCGGNTRHESVFNGLNYLLNTNIDSNDWVLVHDAARCLITAAQIRALIDAVQDDAVGGLLALQVPDTLKSSADGRVATTIDRADKWLAQTPQMFRAGLLHRALREATQGVTDESSAVEQLGLRPKLVEGSAQNFKVTYPEDFALADRVLRGRMNLTAGHLQPTPDASNSAYDYP